MTNHWTDLAKNVFYDPWLGIEIQGKRKLVQNLSLICPEEAKEAARDRAISKYALEKHKARKAVTRTIKGGKPPYIGDPCPSKLPVLGVRTYNLLIPFKEARDSRVARLISSNCACLVTQEFREGDDLLCDTLWFVVKSKDIQHLPEDKLFYSHFEISNRVSYVFVSDFPVVKFPMLSTNLSVHLYSSCSVFGPSYYLRLVSDRNSGFCSFASKAYEIDLDVLANSLSFSDMNELATAGIHDVRSGIEKVFNFLEFQFGVFVEESIDEIEKSIGEEDYKYYISSMDKALIEI